MSRKRFEDEFTVHDLSSASVEIFGLNTLASFRNFFNEEFQLSGDWRVALSEVIFPTKIENIVDENITAYNLNDYEDSQKSLLVTMLSLDLTVDKNWLLCLEHLIQ